MGRFTYQSGTRIDLEDRVLSHLQVVISNKLRRGESFVFTWRDDPSIGDGRTSVWLNPSVALSFKYSGSRQPTLNRAWVEALAVTANSPGGLYIVPEPAPVASGETALQYG
ncbi:ATP-dependent DNA ligase [Microbacterium sp. MC2]